jgi:hypothetical protein
MVIRRHVAGVMIANKGRDERLLGLLARYDTGLPPQ